MHYYQISIFYYPFCFFSGKKSERLLTSHLNCGNLFDPEMILIGGGLSDTAEYWWEALLKTYEALAKSLSSIIRFASFLAKKVRGF